MIDYGADMKECLRKNFEGKYVGIWLETQSTPALIVGTYKHIPLYSIGMLELAINVTRDCISDWPRICSGPKEYWDAHARKIYFPYERILTIEDIELKLEEK
jgi:hypothetical protein